MADISDLFRLTSDLSYFYQFEVKCVIRNAEFGGAIEYYLHELHHVLNNGASAARYARELREGAERLCREQGADLIMPHFRTELGEERFSLYFGKN